MLAPRTILFSAVILLVLGCQNGSAAPEGEETAASQIVRVQIPYQGELSEKDLERYADLEEKLDEVVRNADLGALDGDSETEDGIYSIGLYGPSAKAIADAIRPHLTSLPSGSTLYLRHGDPEDKSAQEETIPLG